MTSCRPIGSHSLALGSLPNKSVSLLERKTFTIMLRKSGLFENNLENKIEEDNSILEPRLPRKSRFDVDIDFDISFQDID
jgi:hypothetical protein